MQNRSSAGTRGSSVLSESEIRQVVGQVSDETVIGILACGASLEEIERAALQLQGEDSVKRAHALTGASACVYDVLSEDAVYATEPD